MHAPVDAFDAEPGHLKHFAQISYIVERAREHNMPADRYELFWQLQRFYINGAHEIAAKREHVISRNGADPVISGETA